MCKHCAYLGLAILVIFLVLLIIWDAQAQEHHHPQPDAAIHEQFYLTWNRPAAGRPRTVSCCNKQDCYPTEFKQEGGTWFAKRREDGVWIVVPEGVLEYAQPDPRESPDARNHVCMQAPGQQNTVFCAVLGSGQ